MLELHVKVPPALTAHLPLLDVRVKAPPVPLAAAVNVAGVPPTYQVPADMMEPVAFEEVVTWRYPLPENGVPGVDVPVATVDVVGDGLPEVLGRYLTPVAGQLDFEPSR